MKKFLISLLIFCTSLSASGQAATDLLPTAETLGVSFLKYGIPGLCALLALYAVYLLTKEQERQEPSSRMLLAIIAYMILAIVLVVLSLASMFPKELIKELIALVRPGEPYDIRVLQGTIFPYNTGRKLRNLGDLYVREITQYEGDQPITFAEFALIEKQPIAEGQDIFVAMAVNQPNVTEKARVRYTRNKLDYELILEQSGSASKWLLKPTTSGDDHPATLEMIRHAYAASTAETMMKLAQARTGRDAEIHELQFVPLQDYNGMCTIFRAEALPVTPVGARDSYVICENIAKRLEATSELSADDQKLLVMALKLEKTDVSTKAFVLSKLLGFDDPPLESLLGEPGQTPPWKEPVALTILDLTRHADPEVSQLAKKITQRVDLAAILSDRFLEEIKRDSLLVKAIRDDRLRVTPAVEVYSKLLQRLDKNVATAVLKRSRESNQLASDVVQKLEAQTQLQEAKRLMVIATGSEQGDRYYVRVELPESDNKTVKCLAKMFNRVGVASRDGAKNNEELEFKILLEKEGKPRYVYWYSKQFAIDVFTGASDCDASAGFVKFPP